jgi:NAD(P)-dependent dehydrogenase (short-subunit alcohol dehydrogenase family)
MSDTVTGRVALVTGSSRGIGYAIARSLVAEGARVMLSARDPERLEVAVQQLAQDGPGEVRGTPCDVRRPDAVRELVRQTVAAFGGLDILVNNAGVGGFGRVSDLPVEVWDQVIGTNLSGAFYCCREAIPHLRARGGGWIVNIGSLAGKNAMADGAAYCASKFGLLGLSESVMLDVRHDNIRVTCLMPGSVATEFNDRRPSAADQWKIQPEDIGRIVLDLLRTPARTLPSRVEIRPTRPPKSG